MKIYYFGGTDPQTSKPFSMLVSGSGHAAAKQACMEWLRHRQRDDLADLIEKSERRALRVIDSDAPCVLHSDVSWSFTPSAKVREKL